jgi:uncharacterized protein YeaO (DUF488 family)
MNKGENIVACITLSRIYEQIDEQQNCIRILIDRIWPRGFKKEEAKIDYWFKEVAPSHELRKWFGHRPERFPEFRQKYISELNNDETKRTIVNQICDLTLEHNVTLLYGAKNKEHNNAVVLKEVILHQRYTLKLS